MGPAVLLDVRGEDLITNRREYAWKVNPGNIVVLFTGHSSLYGTVDYYTTHPVVSRELADFFIERGVKMLGIDCPSPDQSPFGIHSKILEAQIPILENLTNLAALQGVGEFELIAFPLKVQAEACPVRVVARLFDTRR